MQLTGRRQIAVYAGSTPTQSRLSLWLDTTGLRPALKYWRISKSAWRLVGGFKPAQNLGAVSANFTLPDPDVAGIVTATLNASVTISLPTGGVQGDEQILYLTQGTGGSKVPTLTGVKWPGGVVPTWSTVAGKVDKVHLRNYDGTNYEGTGSIDIR